MDIEIQLPDNREIIYCLADVSDFAGVGGVYLMYGYRGELLYVGKTNDFRKRLTEHYNKRSNTAEFMHRVKFIEVYEVESKADTDIYETYLINRLQPKYNVRKVWAVLDRKDTLKNRRLHRNSTQNVEKPAPSVEWSAQTKAMAHEEYNEFVAWWSANGYEKEAL